MNRILIVEDNESARTGLRELLLGAGFAVSTAIDGAEALTMLDEQRFDVMLLDIWMPHMTGLALLERLHDRPDLPKILVMTADDTPETLLMTLRKHAHQFVRKPIDPKGLLALLHTVTTTPRRESDIEVLSARPAWIELLVSCEGDVADRIESYTVNLDVDLPRDMRETMGGVFRELLLDAMEGEGRVDPNRKVRVSYLRAERMLMYRIGDATVGGAVPLRATQRLRPGAILARAQADELLFNEAQNEVVVVKYLN
jgi:CheY-like chemotaxis protein